MDFRKVLIKSLPYIVAVVVFWAMSALYFAPQFSGKTLSMSDVQMYNGGKKDISLHRAEFGEDPQWTGGMFGGMPADQISILYPAMILRNGVQWVMNLVGEPAALMFLAMLGFWLMLLLCGVNAWLAIPFALAYGLSTYNIIIIEVGHITKMRAMGYAPMLVGAVWWTFRRNVWAGGALAALFGALTIAAAHHQITYYFLLVVAAFWINELVATIRAKNVWKRFCVATAVLAGAAVFAAGANFTHLWYTFTNSPDTTRGGSELVDETAVETAGLDLEYATAWSYGTGESFNMFIPNFRGGGSSSGFEPGGEVAAALRKNGYSPSMAEQLPGYWGDQPFTEGPTYIGAVMVFLFMLGMFVLPGRKKWWVFGVSLLGLFLAWGGNMMWFTELAFWGLPGYNKFRTVAMSLAILQWSMPFLAALVVAKLWKGDLDKKKFMRGLWWSLGIAGGTALFFALFGGMIYDFSGRGDGQFSQIPGLVEAMQNERAAMFRADCWRSLLFVALTATVVWAWISLKSVKRWTAVAALSALVLADLVPVDLRYASWDDFMTRSRMEVKPGAADRTILADKEPGFRVLNTQNPFNEAYTSYFHRSIGGYHGAKLRRYQDVIDRYLSKFDMNVLNMLNTKYIIVSDRTTGAREAQLNPDANGAAWFVDNVFFVDGAMAELEALGTIDNKREAVVDERFQEFVTTTPALRATPPQEGNFPLAEYPDDGAIVELIEYRPNYLRYETLSTEERVAVFSEIYYDKGWTAYIDGEEVPYFRADYILRAIVVPPGAHTIEWRFRAPRFALVEGVTLACSIIILLWLAAAIAFRMKNEKLKMKN